MSDFVLEAMEARLNAILAEIRGAGFAVLDASADEVVVETLRVRREPARLALPGPGAEARTPSDGTGGRATSGTGENPRAPKAAARELTDEEKKAKKAAYMREYNARRKAEGKA